MAGGVESNPKVNSLPDGVGLAAPLLVLLETRLLDRVSIYLNATDTEDVRYFSRVCLMHLAGDRQAMPGHFLRQLPGIVARCGVGRSQRTASQWFR
jgi:hypothetical protein